MNESQNRVSDTFTIYAKKVLIIIYTSNSTQNETHRNSNKKNHHYTKIPNRARRPHHSHRLIPVQIELITTRQLLRKQNAKNKLRPYKKRCRRCERRIASGSFFPTNQKKTHNNMKMQTKRRKNESGPGEESRLSDELLFGRATLCSGCHRRAALLSNNDRNTKLL